METRATRRRATLAAAAACCLSAALLTWPTLSSVGRAIPQGNEPAATVALFNLWTLEWNRVAAARGFHGYWDAPIFFPVRDSFALSDPQPLTGLVFAALRALTGDGIAAYDLLIVIVVATNGLAAWGLLRSLGLSAQVTILGGLLVTALPFVANEIGVLQLTVLAPTILALLALVRLVRDTRPTTSLALGGAVAATALTCVQYAVFLTLLLPLALVMWPRGVRWRGAAALAGALLVALVAASPVAWTQARVLRAHAHSAREIARTSATGADWMRVADHGGLATLGWPRTPGFALFPGVVLLGLAALGAGRAARAAARDAPAGWWRFVALAGGAAFALSFGVHLGIGAFRPLALAQANVPWLGVLRSTYRLAAVVQILLALVAALGLGRLWAWRRPVGRGLALGLVCLALFETRVRPVPMYAPPPQPEWITRLGTLPPGPTLALPLPPLSDDLGAWEPVTLEMVQLLDPDRPLLYGYSAFVTPEYRHLASVAGGFPDKPSLAALVLYGARWLSLDARWFDDARRAALGTFGAICHIVSDGPDRVIVEVAPALSTEGRRRRPAAWRPSPERP